MLNRKVPIPSVQLRMIISSSKTRKVSTPPPHSTYSFLLQYPPTRNSPSTHPTIPHHHHHHHHHRPASDLRVSLALTHSIYSYRQTDRPPSKQSHFPEPCVLEDFPYRWAEKKNLTRSSQGGGSGGGGGRRVEWLGAVIQTSVQRDTLR